MALKSASLIISNLKNSMIKKFSLFINLLLLMASKVQAKIELGYQTTHLFLYADLGLDIVE